MVRQKGVFEEKYNGKVLRESPKKLCEFAGYVIKKVAKRLQMYWRSPLVKQNHLFGWTELSSPRYRNAEPSPIRCWTFADSMPSLRQLVEHQWTFHEIPLSTSWNPLILLICRIKISRRKRGNTQKEGRVKQKYPSLCDLADAELKVLCDLKKSFPPNSP